MYLWTVGGAVGRCAAGYYQWNHPNVISHKCSQQVLWSVLLDYKWGP